MVISLGLVVVGCTSSAEDLPDSTSAVTVDSEAQDPTTALHNNDSPPLFDGMSKQAGPESSLPTRAAEEPKELHDPEELVGMRPYTGWGGGNYAGLDGILYIEYPCVYLYPRDNSEVLYSRESTEPQGLAVSAAPSGERVLLSLVEDWTDYDPETNMLTVRELHYVEETHSYAIGAEGSGEGPMASGDRVELAGIEHVVLGHDNICERDFDIAAERISLCRLHACRLEREAQRNADTSP